MFGYIEIHIIMPFLVYTFRMNTSSRSICSRLSVLGDFLYFLGRSSSPLSGQCDFSLVHRNYRMMICTAQNKTKQNHISVGRDQRACASAYCIHTSEWTTFIITIIWTKTDKWYVLCGINYSVGNVKKTNKYRRCKRRVRSIGDNKRNTILFVALCCGIEMHLFTFHWSPFRSFALFLF